MAIVEFFIATRAAIVGGQHRRPSKVARPQQMAGTWHSKAGCIDIYWHRLASPEAYLLLGDEPVAAKPSRQAVSLHAAAASACASFTWRNRESYGHRRRRRANALWRAAGVIMIEQMEAAWKR